MSSKKYDFSGYVTRYGVRCSDGRTIVKDAFADCDGKTVPLVWNHGHDDSDNVLGNVTLERRPDGVYGYGSFNDTDKAQNAKLAVEHGDITALSIYANKLQQRPTSASTKDVLHGKIKEVSLVLAGANIGAFIDTPVIEHSEDGSEYCEGTIYLGDIIDPTDGELEFEHKDSEKEENDMADEKQKTDDEETIAEVYNNAPEKYKLMCAFFVQQALASQGESAEHSEDDDDYEDYDEGEEDDMKHNAFDNDSTENTLCHKEQFINDVNAILADDKKRDKITSFKDFINDVLQHDDEDPVAPGPYGITNITELFPDAKALSNTPDFIKRDDSWVGKFYNNTRKVPYSRIKTIHANITEDEARAKGYIKGTQKWAEVFPLLSRSVEPQTIYKLQQLDHDDMLDIKSINVINFLKGEMIIMLDEEVARAGLLGDGRQIDDKFKIKEDKIKPVYHENALYAPRVGIRTKANADDADKANAFIRACIKSRKLYKGSGSPTLFCTTDMLTDMLLLTDGVGRPLYDTVTTLATKLRVKEIVECELMEGVSRTKDNYTYDLAGIILNPVDYSYGSDNGFDYENFEDFDIDFNQHKILMECRRSGMLTKPYSALIMEFTDAPAGSDDSEDNVNKDDITQG